MKQKFYESLYGAHSTVLYVAKKNRFRGRKLRPTFAFVASRSSDSYY